VVVVLWEAISKLWALNCESTQPRYSLLIVISNYIYLQNNRQQLQEYIPNHASSAALSTCVVKSMYLGASNSNAGSTLASSSWTGSLAMGSLAMRSLAMGRGEKGEGRRRGGESIAKWGAIAQQSGCRMRVQRKVFKFWRPFLALFRPFFGLSFFKRAE
jgi:hypothetical protein